MLAELHVANLGVIEDLTIVLGPGTTALTGETGAGKTLLVDAIELLLGGPADPVLVRPGSPEAVVEGRFAAPGSGEELVLARVVPASGRSRAYVDGRMASAAQLAESGRDLVDLHGQHSHQSLLGASAQRAVLDAFAGVDLDALAGARRRRRDIRAELAAVGGDAHSRARQLDLLRYQLDELVRAALRSPDEDDTLRDEEDRLADASALREAASQVWTGLTGDDGLVDRVGNLVAGVAGRRPLESLHGRLRAVEAELADIAGEARAAAESLEDDPARLAEIGSRRHLLADLRRKYGESLADVIAFGERLRADVEELASHDERAAALDDERRRAEAELARVEKKVWEARRAGAPGFSAAVERRLQDLAMPRARFVVEVGDEPPGDDVTWMLGANPGEPVLPLAKVASGGELARTMLAVRLVAGGPGTPAAGPGGPATLVFDEVDAGIGGEAAEAVGRALAALGADHQVLVVTHLPQVAACADRHLVVRKDAEGDRTVARAREVTGAERVVELSRMLSGRPGSETARRHAEELLAGGGRAPAGPPATRPT